MRILVTGSREWNCVEDIRNIIQSYTTGDDNVTIVHGGARGADEIAGVIARELGVIEEIHPANWDSCGEDCDVSHKRRRYDNSLYCPRAGYVRNAEMVKLGADVCLAFYKGPSKGTDMCATLADNAGIPVHKFVDVS